MSFVVENCQLEVDTDRGVIYVHSPEGYTALRVCGVKSGMPKPSPLRMADITLKFQSVADFTFSW